MPKSKNFNFSPSVEDVIEPIESTSIADEPKVTEPEPFVKEKIEKVGKCKNPRFSQGFDNGDIYVTLYPEKGDVCEFQVAGKNWQPYEKPFPICYEKATVQVKYRATNPTKNDSDVITINLG